MPRPAVDLDPYKDMILEQYSAHTSVGSILSWLRTHHDISISRNLFYQRLKTWGIDRHRSRTQHSNALSDRLAHLYYEYGLSDKAIHKSLTKDGFQIAPSQVEKLRRGLDIYRRMPPHLVQSRKEQLRAFFTAEQQSEGIVRRLGKGNLYTHMRQRQFNLSRDAIFQIYREFHGDAVQARLQQAHRRRGGWTTPGPNYIWSVDGHLKLAQFGFEIYAGIDAFSRFITWFFVGHSALTSRSTFAQYLYVVKEYGFIPQIMRSDRGKETTMMAAAHYLLSQCERARRFPRCINGLTLEDSGGIDGDGPNTPSVISNSQHNVDASPSPATDESHPLPWSQCWSYGKSTQNQRIESWWNQLQENRTLFWRNYFNMLKGTGLWNKESTEDRIALLYIFMPIIRYETAEFVRLWNGHRIRRQRRRQHVVSGIPYELFTMPDPLQGYVDCRVKLDKPVWLELQQLAQIDEVDLDEYLPADTMRICDRVCAAYAGNLSNNPGFHDETPYLPEYERLRQDLRQYSLSGQLPALSECQKPRGSWEELQQILRQRHVNIGELTALAGDDEIDDEC